jgi:hypothetical protein
MSLESRVTLLETVFESLATYTFLNVSPRFNPEAFFNLRDFTTILLSSEPFPLSLFNSNTQIS